MVNDSAIDNILVIWSLVIENIKNVDNMWYLLLSIDRALGDHLKNHDYYLLKIWTLKYISMLILRANYFNGTNLQKNIFFCWNNSIILSAIVCNVKYE